MPEVELALATTHLEADTCEPLSGVLLLSKYRLIDRIGSGGMGTVWKAERLGWDSPVAVKVLSKEAAECASATKRFASEGRLAAMVRSEHMIQVIDDGVDPDTGIAFLVMELMVGQTLEERLTEGGPLPFAQTLQLVKEVAEALKVAHRVGVVHRDLKPSNIFLCRQQGSSRMTAKVFDLGTAKIVGRQTPDDPSLTRAGTYIGTPYYSSPEQLRGYRNLSPLVDLWALAVVTSQCLTGRRPFDSSDIGELAELIIGGQGPIVPSTQGAVPHGFDAWFDRATRPKSTDRFQTFQEMIEGLQQLDVRSPELTVPVSPLLSGDTTEPSVHPLGDQPTALAGWGTLGRLKQLTPTVSVIGAIGLGGGLLLYAGFLRSDEPQVSVSALQPAPPAVPPNENAEGRDQPVDKSAASPASAIAAEPSTIEVDSLPVIEETPEVSTSSRPAKKSRHHRAKAKAEKKTGRKARAAQASTSTLSTETTERTKPSGAASPSGATSSATAQGGKPARATINDPHHPLYQTVIRSVLQPTTAGGAKP